MRTLIATLSCGCLLALAGTPAFAASPMEKGASAPMAKADTMKKEMSMQECRDHLAMASKDTMARKDDARMKKDAACADMMKKDAMKKDEPMKK